MDKIGVTSGNAYDSLEHFAEYLKPSSPSRLDAMLPGGAWNQSQYYLRYYSSGPVCTLPIRAFALKESSRHASCALDRSSPVRLGQSSIRSLCCGAR